MDEQVQTTLFDSEDLRCCIVSRRQIEELIDKLNALKVIEEYPCVDDLVHVIRLLQRQEEEYEVIVRSLTEKLAQCQELSSRHDARCAENARLIEELIVMKAGLEMKCKKAEILLTDTRQELEMKANKNHELHDQIDELTNTLKDMEQSLRDARNEILDNKNFLQIKTAKVEEYEKTIGQLRLDLYEKESYHKKKVTSLEDSLAEVRNTLKNKTVNAVQTERDLRFQLEELEKQLRCKECLITDLEMRYDCAMKTAEASEQQQANKLSLAYQQVEGLQKELREVKASHQELQSRVASSSKSRERDLNTIRTLTENNDKLRTDRLRLENRGQSHRNLLAKLCNKALSLSPNPDTKRLAFQAVVADEIISEQVNNAINKIDALQKAFADQERNMIRQRFSYDGQVRELQAALGAKTKQLEQAGVDQRASDKWKETVKRMIEHDRESNDRLRCELDSANATIASLKEEKLQCQSNEAKLVEQLEQLQRQLRALCPLGYTGGCCCGSYRPYDSQLLRDQINSALALLDGITHRDSLGRLALLARLRLRDAELRDAEDRYRDRYGNQS